MPLLGRAKQNVQSFIQFSRGGDKRNEVIRPKALDGTATPHWRRFPAHALRSALALDLETAGSNKAARMPITRRTTRSSSKVKAARESFIPPSSQNWRRVTKQKNGMSSKDSPAPRRQLL